MLGKTLDELDSDIVFDVIVSIDEVEHVLDVEKFLIQALEHVKQNGLLIISTGNPSCFFWKRIFKSKFWYGLFAEHITFPGYNYYNEFSKRHGLQPPEQIRFRYIRLKFMERFSKILCYVRYLLSNAFFRAMRKTRRMATGNAAAIFPVNSVSLIGVFTDHHVIIFRKMEL